MNTTIAVTKEVATLLNIMTFEPENQEKVIELLRGSTENVVSRLDGWISTCREGSAPRSHLLAVARLCISGGEAGQSHMVFRGSQHSPR